MKTKPKTLIVDNFDSFTYNLVQDCAILGGRPEVFTNDAISLSTILKKKYSHIILSPGPGTVERKSDFGVCADIIDQLAGKIPIFGVCLGHQGIVYRLGGKIVKAPRPMHGKKSSIRIRNQDDLFKNLPETMTVMRYHSLIADRRNFPTDLEILAETDDEENLIMGVKHKTMGLFGVQFHPESIGTPLGKKLLSNFFSSC